MILGYRTIGVFLGLAAVLIFHKIDDPFAQLVTTDNYLLMVTSDACPWCEAFEDEVGVGYPLTNEGRKYPLRRLDYHQTMPVEFETIEPAIITPTFIIVKNGSEVGRIVGYPGQELFWWRISEFIKFETE